MPQLHIQNLDHELNTNILHIRSLSIFNWKVIEHFFSIKRLIQMTTMNENVNWMNLARQFHCEVLVYSGVDFIVTHAR